MRWTDLLLFSWQTLNSHKMRTLLTALGIIIGIASVVILTAIGSGVHRYVLAQFTQFGTNLLAIVPGKNNTFGMSGATISTVRPLSLADATALERLEYVLAAVPLVQGNARIEAVVKQRRASVFGVGARVPEVWKIKVQSGRFLPAGEQSTPRSFAVLGSKLKAELFANRNPLGQRVRVGSDRFRIIGVMEAKGQMLGFDLDDSIYIPAAKALALFDREGLMEIDVLYSENVAVASVVNAVKKLMIARHGEEDFTLITQQQMLQTLDTVLSILTLGIAAIGGISLLVGGVGILTIMTIAVTERTFEIGLLRAIGAEKKVIFSIFLSEALMLSLSGGTTGIVTGVVIVQVIAIMLPDLPVFLNWDYMIAAFILAMIIGLLSGVIPAIKAAGLVPLEALRAE